MEEITFLVEKDEDGYTARALEEAIFTQGNSIKELKNNIIDAIKCHFDKDFPQKVKLIYVEQEELISV